MSGDLALASLNAIKAVPDVLRAFAAAPTPANAWDLYGRADPLTSAIIGALFLGVLSYVLNATTGNCSFVDKMWSIIPPCYIVHFAVHAPLTRGADWNARVVIIALLTSAWGMRLTYNFWRKGGYTWEGEDYRWPELRKNHITNRLAWELFSFTFIAIYQHLLLLAFASPAWAALTLDPKSRAATLNGCDYALTALFVVLLLGETTADQQQWNFQTAKYALLNAKQSIANTPYAKGFVTSGLWRFSRHPNFFCEISMWYTVYFLGANASVASAGKCVCLNVTLIGAVLLNLLFLGSTSFTEAITGKKYPAYVHYQQTTSRLIPFIPSSEPKDQTKDKDS